MLRYKR